MDSPIESALVILAPEAEPLVKPFRDRYDPSAAQGVPAHFTILYPFKPPSELTAAVVGTLNDLFLRFPPFTIALSELRRFPEVLYLTPRPTEPIKQLIQATAERFPETPPYKGEFAEVIPHLTIAQVNDSQRLNAITADFQRAAQDRLPLQVSVSEVTLMDNESGLWRVRAAFRLARR